MNGLAYLIQVNLYLVLFYGLYLVLLRNETFFKMNRVYLMGSALLSMMIPLLKAEWVNQLFVTDSVKEFSQTFNTIITDVSFPTGKAAESAGNLVTKQPLFVLADWLTIIYVAVTLLLLFNFFRKLYLLNRVLKGDFNGKAFSFFNRIAIDERLEGKETIMEHELVHVKQWHSADVLFFEIFALINWFNPIAFGYKRSIKTIHEFIADETASNFTNDKAAYALLLVSNSFNTQPEHLTNNFFNQTLLKRRLIMLNKSKSKKVAILKYGFAAPLFAAMVIFSSATAAGKKIIYGIVEATSPTFENLSNGELQGVEETESVDLAIKVQKRKLSKELTKDQVNIEYPTIKTGPQTNIEKMLDSIDRTRPQNLIKYIKGFFKGKSLDIKGGRVYYSFDVSKDKKTSNYRIARSIDSDWENELLSYLTLFKDTVSLDEGTYNFFQGIAFFDVNDKIRATGVISIPRSGQAASELLFGSTITSTVTISTVDETKEGAGKIVNYIKVDYIKNPIILVDGKIAKYKITDKGFKLDDPIYPKNFDTKVYKGDKAVANYDESARSGLIVITTYPPTPAND